MVYVDIILLIGYFYVFCGFYDENWIEDKFIKLDFLEVLILF